MPLEGLVSSTSPAELTASLGTAPSDPERMYRESVGPSGERPGEVEESEDLSAVIAALEAAEEAPTVATRKTGPVQPCPAKIRHSIEARIIDERDRPLENVGAELRRSDNEAISTRSNADGLVRFEGVDPGSYELVLPELDEDSWALEGSEALPTERDRVAATARWKAPAAVSSTAKTHVVEEGQCTTTIAYRSGWLDDALWEASENSTLRKQRVEKNILAPGDSLVIPPVRLRKEAVKPSTAYTVRRKGVVAELSIGFCNEADEPRKGEPYLIRLVSDAGTEERLGKTNGDGFVVEPVDPSTTDVTVVLGEKGPAQQSHTFTAATLDPIDTIGGVQGRLINLGYEVDDKRGELGPHTRRALRDFQRDRELEVTCEIDDATRDEIVSLHLS